MTVASQVHKAQIGILPIGVGKIRERSEPRPLAIFSARKEPRCDRAEFNQIKFPVSLEIQKLLAPSVHRCQRRMWRKAFDRPEASLAKIRFVKPGVSGFGKDPRYALAIKINPAIVVAVNT